MLEKTPPLAKWPNTQRARLKKRKHIKSRRRKQLASPATVAVWRCRVQRELLDFGILSPRRTNANTRRTQSITRLIIKIKTLN